MSKKDKPRLGEWVRFTHYTERPTGDEYRQAIEDGEDAISARQHPNPEPDKPAMVIGQVRKSMEAVRPDSYATGEPLDHFIWTHGERQTFYILKRSIRGRRFLVTVEDLIRDGGDTP